MDLITFLISVFCLVDNFPKDKRLRQRGPQPILQDSDVMAMESSQCVANPKRMPFKFKQTLKLGNHH